MKNFGHSIQMAISRGADLDMVCELYGAYRRAGETDVILRQRGIRAHAARQGEPCDRHGRPVIDGSCEEVRS